MTDRELLEAAAKAAGYAAEYVEWDDVDNGACAAFMVPNSGGWGKNVWNPLTDDGDALRRIATTASRSSRPTPRRFTAALSVATGRGSG